jgi:hypothetical protein
MAVSAGHRRAAVRKPAQANVEVCGTNCRTFSSRFTDLSVHGCSIAIGDTALQPGQFITVRSSRTDPVPGIVRWARGDRAGIEFLRPISDALVRSLRARA